MRSGSGSSIDKRKVMMIGSLVRSISELWCQGVQQTSALCLRGQPILSCSGFRAYTSLLSGKQNMSRQQNTQSKSLLHRKQEALTTTQVRTTTYELKQWREGRVINRFYRLHWGAWIRTFGGRDRQLYKKTSLQRWRLKQHIFVTRKQSRLLDVLVTKHWKDPKYFVDNPEYEPYHKRTNSYHFPNHRKFYP